MVQLHAQEMDFSDHLDFWSSVLETVLDTPLRSTSPSSDGNSSRGNSPMAGRDYKFVGEPDADLKCPICLQVATEPVVHEACKKIFCKKCIRSHGEEKPCPHCRRQRYSTDDQSRFEREVS